MPNLTNARAQRFHAYVERLTTALGHQDRHGPLRAYVTGLCLPGDRIGTYLELGTTCLPG